MLEILAAIFIVVACFFLLAAVFGVRQAPDALSRTNSLGTMTSVALPLFLIAGLLYDASQGNFSWYNLIVAILAIIGMWSMVAVAGFVMGRGLYELEKEQ
ncbi:MAG: Na+/H+ antiporter subunit G [Corynebacterium sp.]|nr:Na+/H+ antiporter subunit G [Corynebacterium sp.]